MTGVLTGTIVLSATHLARGETALALDTFKNLAVIQNNLAIIGKCLPREMCHWDT